MNMIMLGQLIIMLRESFEAVLITSIILAYLKRTNREHLTKYVWYGFYVAIVFSVLLGVAIWSVYGSLERNAQILFEGSAAWLAVIVLSSMIYWMALKGKRIKEELEIKVERAISRGVVVGLFSFAFIIVFREGLETVLFLTPFLVSDILGTLLGTFLGGIGAIMISYMIYSVGMKINLRRFFYYTSILLILLAGGLAGYGTHEFIEYSESIGIELGWLAEKAYVLPISSDNVFHHKSVIGAILAVMFGYTTEAEWARLIIHILYLTIAIPLVVNIYRRP